MSPTHTHHTLGNVRRTGLHRFVFPALSALLVGVLCSSLRAEAQTQPDTLTDAGEADHLIVDVVESLGVDLVRGSSSAESSGAHALVSTRESPTPMLLWVDSVRSSITLLRAADGHLLSRRVARDTFSYAPYAAAVIATEMVELMREAPLKGGLSGRAEGEDLRAQVTSHADVAPSSRGPSTDVTLTLAALGTRGRCRRLSRRPAKPGPGGPRSGHASSPRCRAVFRARVARRLA